jgi:hypothetical protein
VAFWPASAPALTPTSSLRAQLQLSQLGFFDHGRSCTLWCDPQSPELLQLQARLQGAFPFCDDLSSDPARGITRFRPHLSLGQWGGVQRVTAALQVRRARRLLRATATGPGGRCAGVAARAHPCSPPLLLLLLPRRSTAPAGSR